MDTTKTTKRYNHRVTCFNCHRSENISLDDPKDISYLEDILKELHWTTKGPLRICNQCSSSKPRGR